ncbi:hypothetical protein KG112_16590 [Nocardioides sp. zg-ZUI104]|uniref:PKD domain-containing protein n=1 Tax=Nocardioides faecalis TaxID=2803858 RepID=UPI001BCFD862|nr:PKD domain-containing protein [Nocardioides faecalis]MBS4754427.1 hypothetical protein [Nocardioides faecalis]
MLGTSTTDFCAGPPTPDEPQLTGGMIARAFSELPLPGSALNVQPPDGVTLVNFDTNFYVEPRPLQRTITLLGQQVQLRIWAASYHWRFGDGTVLDSTSPGAPYPDLEVTHEYLRTGRYGARVDTTYQAEYRVGTGAWQPVEGTSTISGTPVTLRAVEASPSLVGADR